MMSVDVEVDNMCSYLASMSLSVTRDWLTGCVEYFRGENSHYNQADLQDFVKKQWELSNLRESSDGNLPLNLKTQLKVTLRGKYAVQIESIIDISQPAYSQILKMRKVDIVNVEATEKKPESWEPRASRMLKLKLCDGSQEAEAIEYRPIHTLNYNTLPGTKILITGPVDCRRGVLFLKPHNVRIIGGEVDTLLIPNHIENVLARTLGLPENPDPLSTSADDTQSTPITDTQRSTYTPAIAASSVPSRQNSVGSRNPGRNPPQQRQMHEFLRSAPQAEPSTEVLADLDVTNWAADDLLADGDDVFIDLPEDVPLVSSPVPSATNSSMIVVPKTNISKDKSCGNNFFNNRMQSTNSAHNVNSFSNPSTSYNASSNISSAVNSNKVSLVNKHAVFKVPQIPSGNTQRSNQTKNPFLVADDYFDDLEIEDWNGEETNDFINVPANSTPDNIARKQVLSTQPTSSFFRTDLSGPRASSEKGSLIEAPNCNLQFASSRSLIGKQGSTFSCTNNSNANLSARNINECSLSEPNVNSRPIFQSSLYSDSSVKANSSSDSTNVRQRFEPTTQNSNINKRPATKLFRSKEPPAKTFIQDQDNDFPSAQLRKQVASPPNDAFDNEDDWADAFLNTSSTSYLNKVDNANKLFNPSRSSPSSSNIPRKPSLVSKEVMSASTTEPNITKSSSFESLRCLSSSSSPRTQFSNLSNIVIKPSTSKEVVEFPREDFTDNKSPFVKSRTHLQPTISSPSLMNEQDKVVSKSPEVFSSSNEGVNKFKTISSSPESSSKCKVATMSNEPPTTSANYSLKSTAPFEYVVNVVKSSEVTGVHRFKATILSLLSTLKTDENCQWSLSAKICDGTSNLDVKFSVEVLDELIGMSAMEFKSMKKDVPKNPLLRDKLIKILQKSRDKLININYLFDVNFKENKMAEVVNLKDLTAEDVNKLKLRVESS